MAQPGAQSAQNDDLADLIGLEVRLVDVVRQFYRPVIQFDDPEDTSPAGFGHFNYKNPAYLLAHLYRLEHPANPLRGDAEVLEMALGLADRWVRDWRAAVARGERVSTSEWPIYGTAEMLHFLGDAIGARRRAEWSEFVEAYCRYAVERPFGMTAPNHEAWRFLALCRAGEILDRADWCEAALFFCEQLIELQTPDGFWEEGRHHGPSMGYNGHLLSGLALLHARSGARFVRDSGERLAAFMCAATFPDGTTIGCFDGRLPGSPGYPVVPGLEWLPAGRTLNARGIVLWRRSGRFEAPGRFANSLWSAMANMLFYAAACHYYAEMLPAEERRAALAEGEPLPTAVDSDGAREWHSAEFAGRLERRGPWVLALSAQNSDVPKDQNNEFRLERQSRIDVWHEGSGLVLGGGHNPRNAVVPFANVVMDTGFAGETRFGAIDPASQPERRGYYLPRWTSCGTEAGVPFLRVVFGHGAVIFRFDLSNPMRLGIRAEWSVRNVRRLLIQLPLLVWAGGTLRVDGTAIPDGQCGAVGLRESLGVAGGPCGAEVELRLPSGAEARVHPALAAMKYNPRDRAGDEVTPPFRVALASCQWTGPSDEGGADFELRVKGSKAQS